MTNCYILKIAFLCSLITFVITIPLPMPEPLPLPAGTGNNQELDLLQIPLSNGKEIDVLTLGTKDQEELIAERNKRTIGLLRELFPDITKETDKQINRVVNNILQRIGPAILGTALNANSQQPRQPLNPDNLMESDFHINGNASLPDDFIIFKPDAEFEANT